ncbi:STY4528 family pathogenicity island replication protein, partial [Escherichia coli]|nr:STY4528 family pathogenicity island replication protein [Escherichia coli]
MTPYIQALIAMTGDKLQQRMLKDPGTASDSLLFMGNQHDTVPRRLLQDPLLSPRDKFAWQVIRMQAQDNGGAVFPSYSELQVQLSNRPQDEKASRSTVSRALLMLRLTRWLSLCHKARDRVSGRILGNVYALHDEPLSVLDAVRFDASYLHLLEQCSRHENKAIRATAQGILYDIRQDTSLRYLSSRIELLEERARWQQRQS